MIGNSERVAIPAIQQNQGFSSPKIKRSEPFGRNSGHFNGFDAFLTAGCVRICKSSQLNTEALEAVGIR
jgi:hypothetical protein